MGSHKPVDPAADHDAVLRLARQDPVRQRQNGDFHRLPNQRSVDEVELPPVP